MGDLLVRRTGRIFGVDIEPPAAILIRGGLIESVMAEADARILQSDVPYLDVAGRAVLPGFVDAHTHLVFAGDRADEYAARLEGRPYEPGGIMRTVERTRAAGLDELVTGVVARAEACLDLGTTTIEVKSGYGLETGAERRSLKAVWAANERVEATLVPTFLGAHLDLGGDYIEQLVEEMLPACAPLARGCDAFCDEGILTVDQARSVLAAGREHGLVPHIHAEQLAHSGGARLAADLRCTSADHLVHATEEDARAMAAAGVVAVLLPSASFCMGSGYAPARMLLDAGVEVALGTDCNPGTSYTTSMPFVITLACNVLGMTADEAVRAATLGGAHALGMDDVGHVSPGAQGDLVVLDAEHWIDIPYHPGMNMVGAVVKDGVVVRGS